MNEKKFQFSAREVGRLMDETTRKVVSGETNVNVGTMMISEFKAIMSAYRLQLDHSKITGKPMENPLVNMD